MNWLPVPVTLYHSPAEFVDDAPPQNSVAYTVAAEEEAVVLDGTASAAAAEQPTEGSLGLAGAGVGEGVTLEEVSSRV